MSPIDISRDAVCGIAIWVSSNVTVWRQYGYWYDTQTKYVFAPSYPYGFVVVTGWFDVEGCTPLAAWKVWRQAGLSLTWSNEGVYRLVDITTERATDWYNACGCAWRELAIRPRNRR
jgi:hypothetical protein